MEKKQSLCYTYLINDTFYVLRLIIKPVYRI